MCAFVFVCTFCVVFLRVSNLHLPNKYFFSFAKNHRGIFFFFSSAKKIVCCLVIKNQTSKQIMSQNQQQQQARNRAMWNPEQVTQGELEILEQLHLHALSSNKDVRNMLKSTELQELIKNIDKSKCRLEALATAQHNIPQFKEFCDLLLNVIYSAEDGKYGNRR
jgi:hypothetical protein